MAANDAFSQQIVELVRKMPDDAILALVRNQLQAVTSGPAPRISAPTPRARATRERAAAPAAAPAAPARKEGRRGAAPKRRAAGRPRASAGSAERQNALSAVERLVKSSSGLSASEVAKNAGIPQTRAAAALKELKLAKRIFQGGDRRFARYAGDARQAEAASMNARKSATGPMPRRTAPKAKRRAGKK